MPSEKNYYYTISAERAPRSGQTAGRRLVERGPEGEAGHIGAPK